MKTMSHILPGLIVGSVEDAFDKNILSRARVSTILNVASELMFTERIGLRYYKMGIEDDSFVCDIRDILPDCLNIIQSTIDLNDTIIKLFDIQMKCLLQLSNQA
jgi:hypothetical protein